MDTMGTSRAARPGHTPSQGADEGEGIEMAADEGGASGHNPGSLIARDVRRVLDDVEVANGLLRRLVEGVGGGQRGVALRLASARCGTWDELGLGDFSLLLGESVGLGEIAARFQVTGRGWNTPRLLEDAMGALDARIHVAILGDLVGDGRDDAARDQLEEARLLVGVGRWRHGG